MAVPEISHDVAPESYKFHPMVFILRQLHETLLIKSIDGVTSSILTNWQALNEDYSKYKFCIRKNVRFSNGKLVSPLVLKNNFYSFQAKGYLLKDIKSTHINGDCLTVEFASNYYGLFPQLQSIRFAIVDLQSDKKLPVGISPYILKTMSSRKIVMEVASHIVVKPYVKRVEIVAVGYGRMSTSRLKKFDEINLLRSFQLPSQEILSTEFSKFEIFEPKNLYLILNRLDKPLRKVVRNCVNQRELVEATGFVLKSELKSYLPGHSGVKSPFEQNCNDISPMQKAAKVELMYFFGEDRASKVESVLNGRLKKKNVTFKVSQMSKKEVLGILTSEKKDYQSVLLMINGSNYVAISTLMGLGERKTSLLNFDFGGRKSLLGTIKNGSVFDQKRNLTNFFSHLDKVDKVIPISELKTFAYYSNSFPVINKNSNFSFFEYQIKDIASR